MKAVEIAFVCYAVTDLKRAQGFYEGVLKLKPTSVMVKDNSFGFIEYDIGATTLAIGAGAPNFKPGKAGGTVALEMDNFDSAVKELREAKVKFLMEPHDCPSCQMALVEDPDGNQIMIHQRKKK